MSIATTVGRVARPAAKSVRLAAALASGRALPFSITFILTNRCNFRCAYCNVPDAAGEELSSEEFWTAIDELAAGGMARASFSGGEALLRADAVDIIAHARSRGMVTALNSNAWLIEPQLERLAEVLDVLMLSLDGPREIHDLVRRRTGSYDRVIRCLDAAKRRGLVVTTITVLNKHNLDVMDDVLELADRHGFWAYFQPAYEDCFDHSRGLDPTLTHDVLSNLAARLDTARSSGMQVGASKGYTRRLARGPRFGDCIGCTAGRYFATLMPDGRFVPCHLTEGDHDYPNGRELGFLNAFHALPRPKAGPGCAISPYQELDLIFALDRAALAAAARKLVSGRLA